MTPAVHELLASIAKAIEAAAWTSKKPPPLHGQHITEFRASAYGWDLFVIAFATEDGSYPPGNDGTAVKGGMIVRLTPELASRAVELASKMQN